MPAAIKDVAISKVWILALQSTLGAVREADTAKMTV
jgi:hypothetical protein